MSKMNKIIAVIILLSVFISFVGCSGKKNSRVQNDLEKELEDMLNKKKDEYGDILNEVDEDKLKELAEGIATGEINMDGNQPVFNPYVEGKEAESTNNNTTNNGIEDISVSTSDLKFSNATIIRNGTKEYFIFKTDYKGNILDKGLYEYGEEQFDEKNYFIASVNNKNENSDEVNKLFGVRNKKDKWIIEPIYQSLIKEDYGYVSCEPVNDDLGLIGVNYKMFSLEGELIYDVNVYPEEKRLSQVNIINNGYVFRDLIKGTNEYGLEKCFKSINNGDLIFDNNDKYILFHNNKRYFFNTMKEAEDYSKKLFDEIITERMNNQTDWEMLSANDQYSSMMDQFYAGKVKVEYDNNGNPIKRLIDNNGNIILDNILLLRDGEEILVERSEENKKAPIVKALLLPVSLKSNNKVTYKIVSNKHKVLLEDKGDFTHNVKYIGNDIFYGQIARANGEGGYFVVFDIDGNIIIDTDKKAINAKDGTYYADNKEYEFIWLYSDEGEYYFFTHSKEIMSKETLEKNFRNSINKEFGF